jgi:hypothetical protein
MPTYLGEEVGQAFLDMLVRVYRQGYEAAHPTHQPPMQDDVTLIADMEATITLGGPDADGMARYLANPPVMVTEGPLAGQILGGGGQAWPKEGWDELTTKKTKKT